MAIPGEIYLVQFSYGTVGSGLNGTKLSLFSIAKSMLEYARDEIIGHEKY